MLLLKGLLTPGNTVKQSINLMKFAQSKNHAGFKVASYILGGLGGAVFAVPAAIETYIKAPFKIIKAIAQSVKSRNTIKNKQAFDLSQEQIKERAEKEKNLKQQVREIDSVIVTIKIKDPVAALEKALKLIKQGKIPMFDPKTRQSIEHQIANTKNKELREKRMKEFEEVVNYSIERVKSASKPVAKEKVFEDSSAKEERKDKRKSFIRQHGDKRDEAEVSKENQVAAVAEEDLADKRRPGVEAKK